MRLDCRTLLLTAISLAMGLSGARALPLSLERLYSVPSLIGTPPAGLAWSHDSRRIAFLWNDEGRNFHDLWLVSIEERRPRRVTRTPHPEPEATGTDEIKRLRRQSLWERDRGIASVLWFPDDGRLLFTFRGDLYQARPGGAVSRLTRTPEVESQAAFSPDGRWLAFLRGGDLWLASVTPEGIDRARRLSRIASSRVRVESYRWSGDGHRIAFLWRDDTQVPRRILPDYLGPEMGEISIVRPFPGQPPPRRRLGVLQVPGGALTWMKKGGEPEDLIFSYRWSPDSRRLLLDTSDLYVKARRLLALDAADGRATLFYAESDPGNVSAYWQAEWAPDGRGVYFLSDRDDYYHVYFVAAPGAPPRPITRGPWAVARFAVSRHAGALDLVANRGDPAQRQIFRVGLQGGEPVRVSRRPGTHTPVFSPDGRWAADVFSSDTTPPDLFLTRLDPSGERSEIRITRSPLPEFSRHLWIRPRYVTFPSHVDGVRLHGRLLLPPDLDPSRRYPAILGSVYANTLRNQWGGRNAHPVWGLDQYLVGEGYVILNVNIRGSWGLGRAFRRRIRLDYGGIDTEDLLSGVRYLATLGYVDMSRIGIWGSSYGGLLTCMSLFKHPGVYRAGVAGAPATSVWHATTGEMWVMGRPQDHAREYARSSAFTHAAGLADHLMIIHGMRDRIVLFQDSMVLLERLMLLGKRGLVEFVPLPRARHLWDREGRYQRLYAYGKLVDHFERYLGKGPR